MGWAPWPYSSEAESKGDIFIFSLACVGGLTGRHPKLLSPSPRLHFSLPQAGFHPGGGYGGGVDLSRRTAGERPRELAAASCQDSLLDFSIKGRRGCAWAERQLCLMQTRLNASQDAQGATEATWESHLDPWDSSQG